jgi:DNA topoisomerase-3
MNELQMEGFSRFGYTGDEVMEAAQKLYDTYKVMTYPRTDVRFLSEAHHAEAPCVIAGIIQLRPDLQAIARELDPYRKSAAFNDAKMRTPTGEPTPHHGIIPSIPENPVNVADWSEPGAERVRHGGAGVSCPVCSRLPVSVDGVAHSRSGW